MVSSPFFFLFSHVCFFLVHRRESLVETLSPSVSCLYYYIVFWILNLILVLKSIVWFELL
jgi:hypothetical protein